MSDKIASVNAQDEIGVIEKARFDSMALVEETRVITGKKYEADRQEAGAEVESSRQMAGDSDAAQKESGYFSAKKAPGSTEAGLYGEIASKASGIASLEIAKTGYEILARGQDAAAGHGLGPNVKTMDQIIKSAAKKDTLKSPIRTNPIQESGDGLLARTQLTKDFQSKGLVMRNQDSKLDGKYVATEEVVGGMKLASLNKLSMANLALLQRSALESAAERGIAPSPGGGGSGPTRVARGPSLENNSPEKGPTFREDGWDKQQSSSSDDGAFA